jgi:hypothetical protein
MKMVFPEGYRTISLTSPIWSEQAAALAANETGIDHTCLRGTMKKVNCQGCRGHFALNETVTANERCLCQECIEKEIAAEQTTWEEVVRNVDTTICAQCGKDNGEAAFEVIAGVGVCPRCAAWLRNRPWPEWLKPAFAFMIIVVALAGVWNWRFVDAYLDVKSSHKAIDGGDFSRAALLMESAGRSVPESPYVRVMTHYLKGMDFYLQDKQSEAYAEFCICCDTDPSVEGFKAMRTHAAIGKAFEDKDYDAFLRLTLEYADTSGDTEAAGMLASAYSCKYAVTREEQYKAKAMEYIEKVRDSRLSDARETYEDYEDRMLHRMETGEIIKQPEFKKRYPNGYKAGKEGL